MNLHRLVLAVTLAAATPAAWAGDNIRDGSIEEKNAGTTVNPKNGHPNAGKIRATNLQTKGADTTRALTRPWNGDETADNFAEATKPKPNSSTTERHATTSGKKTALDSKRPGLNGKPGLLNKTAPRKGASKIDQSGKDVSDPDGVRTREATLTATHADPSFSRTTTSPGVNGISHTNDATGSATH